MQCRRPQYDFWVRKIHWRRDRLQTPVFLRFPCGSAGRESESENRSVVSDSLQPEGLYSPWNSLGQNTGVGCQFLLQGIFPTQESYPGLPHCRKIFLPSETPGKPFAYLRQCQKPEYMYSQGRKFYLPN